MHVTSAIGPVQRGVNRPSGNTNRLSKPSTYDRYSITRIGKIQAASDHTRYGTEDGIRTPTVIRKSDMTSPTQPTELRQKMSTAISAYPATTRMFSTARYAAYASIDRPARASE